MSAGVLLRELSDEAAVAQLLQMVSDDDNQERFQAAFVQYCEANDPGFWDGTFTEGK